MRSAIRLFVSATGGLLLLSPLAAVRGNADPHSKFAGVYVSVQRSEAKSAAFMNLSLGPDGTATVTEDPGNGTKTLFGHWVDTGSQVTVTFDAEEGQPAEPAMAFQAGHDGLAGSDLGSCRLGQGNPRR